MEVKTLQTASKRARKPRNTRMRIYYVLDLDAIYGNRPCERLTAYHMTATTAAEMDAYYGGRLEIYSTIRAAKDALSWYELERRSAR